MILEFLAVVDVTDYELARYKNCVTHDDCNVISWCVIDGLVCQDWEIMR